MKKKDKWALIISILALIVSLFAACFTFWQGLIANEQKEIDKMERAPYFSLEPVYHEGRIVSGFTIKNQGGRIQYADLTYRRLLSVTIKSKNESKEFLFPYVEVTKHYFDSLEDAFEIELAKTTTFDDGVVVTDYYWTDETRLIVTMLSSRMDEEEILSEIGYIEVLSINYVDNERAMRNERYMVGKTNDEPSGFYLSPASNALLDQIQGKIPSDFVGVQQEYTENTYHHLDYTGIFGFNGRSGVSSNVLVDKVLDILRDYISSL